MVTILFISDGSIMNPILHSQGLPLLNNVTELGYRSFVFTREKKLVNKKQIEAFNSIKDRFNKINFIHSFEKIYKRGNWFFNLYADTKIINKLILSEEVKIIHCRSLIPGILGFLFKIKTLGKVKLIYDNRGLRILEEIEKGHWKNRGFKVRIFTYVEKKLLKYSDAIVVVSKFFRSYLLRHYQNLNLEKKITVIPNRTHLSKNFNKGNRERSIDSILGVYTGSAVKWQSPEEFTELVSSASEVFKKIKILILTYNVEEFRNVFFNFPELNDRVIIKNVSQEEVYNELLNCNYGILMRMEGLMSNVSSPLKFAEYLAAGLPVMVKEGVGDTEEIILNNKVGVVLRNNDYLQAQKDMKILLEDPDIYLRCRRLAEKEYDIKTSFDQYLNIYRKLTEQ